MQPNDHDKTEEIGYEGSLNLIGDL